VQLLVPKEFVNKFTMHVMNNMKAHNRYFYS